MKRKQRPDGGGPPGKRGGHYGEDYFARICEECGLEVGHGDEPRFTLEAAVFLGKLTAKIESGVDRERNVVEFVDGFRKRTEDLTVLEGYCRGGNEAPVRILAGAGGDLGDEVCGYVASRAAEVAVEDDPARLRSLLGPLTLVECRSGPYREALANLVRSAGPAARLELLALLPELVAGTDAREEVADAAAELLGDEETPVAAVLSCLSCLGAGASARSRALALLRSPPSADFHRTLIDFLFAEPASEAEISESIAAIRSGLDWRGLGSETEVASGQALAGAALRNAFVRSRRVASAFLRAISTAVDAEPLDPVVLLILHSSSPSRGRPVEALFARKARAGSFPAGLPAKTFDRFGPMLRLHREEWSPIVRRLLASSDRPAVEFAEAWLRTAFARFEDCRRGLVADLTGGAPDGREAAARTALLSRIADDDPAALADHSLRLLALADRREDSSAGTREIFDLVCRLAFAVDDSKIRSDVRVMIAKRLSASRIAAKVRGAIAAAAAVRHLVGGRPGSEPTVDLESESIPVDDLPEGRARDAATIVESVARSAVGRPDVLILFRDELSRSLRAVPDWDADFLVWLCASITGEFQSAYVVDGDSAPSSVGGVKVATMHCLNSAEEAEDQIALNVAGVVFEGESGPARLLPSTFRLMCAAYARKNRGDLGEIDALLGCGVVLPDVDLETDLENCDPAARGPVLDCLCLCLNWFRELVGGFASHADAFLRERVLRRLNACRYLQSIVGETVRRLRMTEYRPLRCDGDIGENRETTKTIVTKKPPKTKTKSKKSKDVSEIETEKPNDKDEENVSMNAPMRAIGGTAGLDSSALREIGVDCFNLLGENLSTEPIDLEGTLACSDFRLPTMLYLSEEIVPKLCSTFEESRVTPFSKPSGKVRSRANEALLVDEFVKSLPKLFRNLETIGEYVRDRLDQSEGVRDASEAYSENSILAQFCLAASFQIMKLFLCRLNKDDDRSKFKNALKIIARLRDEENERKNLLKDLVAEVLLYFLKYKEWCLQISSAVALLNLLNSLASFSDANLRGHVHRLSLEFLSSTWNDIAGAPEKGLEYNRNVGILLTSYFADPKIKAIKEILFNLKDQVPKLKNSTSVLDDMRSINKLNFPLLYRALYNALFEAVKFETGRGITDKQHLDIWSDVAFSLKCLIEILKMQETRSNLLTFLKKSVPLFKLFLSQGMPMLEMKLKDDPDSVVEILKSLQYSTRFLQTLNCHSRLKKDTAFMAYQPQMKMILETLIYKVKAALIANKCSEAFWMGNLKNKNLNGEIIASQQSEQSDELPDDEDNQLPDDDSTSSDLDDDIDADCKSLSNVF